jgi:hypothetical protein
MRRQQDVTVKRNKTYKRKAQSVRCWWRYRLK